MNKLIEEFEKGQMKNEWPAFSEGDTIVVSKEIVEGKKKRIQKYQGLVIKTQNNFFNLENTPFFFFIILFASFFYLSL